MISNRFWILNRLHTFVRSREPLCVKSLLVREHGVPKDVVQMEEEPLTATDSNQVLLKVLAAPIHPVHIELIKGDKASPMIKFPFVPGSECVGEVASVGEEVRGLSIGQRVIVPNVESICGRGTWSNFALYNDDDVLPIPDDIGILEAATLAVYPCAAYCILKNFITLKSGDCVLLNGGLSALGQAILQLCKAWGLNSVSVVRPGGEASKDYLKCLGATEVLTPNELLETKIFDDCTLPKPLLALSCVARSSSKFLGRFLDPNGIMVTYGFMAGYSAAAATTAFVYKDFVVRPFWINRFNKNNPKMDERICMIDELCSLIKSGQFHAPEMERIPFMQYKCAFEELEEFKSNVLQKKFILDMTSEG